MCLSSRLSLFGSAQELEHREKQYNRRLRIPVYVRDGDTEKVRASLLHPFYGCAFKRARIHGRHACNPHAIDGMLSVSSLRTGTVARLELARLSVFFV